MGQESGRRPKFEAEALGNFEHWHFDRALYDALVDGLRGAGLELHGVPGSKRGSVGGG